MIVVSVVHSQMGTNGQGSALSLHSQKKQLIPLYIIISVSFLSGNQLAGLIRRDEIILSFPVTFQDFSGSVGRGKIFLPENFLPVILG